MRRPSLLLVSGSHACGSILAKHPEAAATRGLGRPRAEKGRVGTSTGPGCDSADARPPNPDNQPPPLWVCAQGYHPCEPRPSPSPGHFGDVPTLFAGLATGPALRTRAAGPARRGACPPLS